MGVGRILSKGGTLGDFSKIFPGGPKVVKFGFYPSKLKKQPFLLTFSKSRGAKAPPTDAHDQKTYFQNKPKRLCVTTHQAKIFEA